MDWFYFVIVLFALAVFFLDRCHNPIKESFSESDFPPVRWGVNYGATSPEQVGSQGLTNIKIPGTPKWKSGFRKFGALPPNPRCNITVLGEQCTNYPQDTTTTNLQPICQKSYNLYPSGSQYFGVGPVTFTSPINVMGRSVSRVRQCENLFDPPKGQEVPN